MSNPIPSTEDLMLYVDGELTPEREAEVEAYLMSSEDGRALVASFHELGALVRGDAHDKGKGADDIADWVMGQIEAEAKATVTELPVRRQADKSLSSKPSDRPLNNVVPLRPALPVPDDGRRMLAIAGYGFGLFAAAAAALLVGWHFLAPVSAPPIAAVTAAPTNLVVASAPTSQPDVEPQPGVYVDAVDFGARSGSIFYVPNDTGALTTVVWLTDDETGGKP